jgi:TP901 family phage tail tape measure protein
MSEKDLNYRLTADSSQMDRGFKSAEASARVFERELARLEAQQKRVHDAMSMVGKGMLAGGAAIAAGLALAVKAAINWESAWTGVAKVVEGSPEQMAALEEQLRGLTLVLPQSAQEIAGVAAEAGALGIARQDIADFTKTMVMMGTATNLTSLEAADALARLMNIMKTAPSDVDRLGSTIVALGNAGASTESEITAMALRIAGAGQIIGLSESDVLGFASALSSVGIEAEAGGSAISTVFVKIETAVRSGGEKLDRFAAIAGMTAEQFRQAYQTDAAGAIDTFIQGLGGIARSGGDVFRTLEGLNITEIRQRDALLRLAGAGTILTQSLQTGEQAWRDNTALAAEAERRYQTVEARMQIARNAITDLAIDLGQVLLPVVGKAADTVSGLVQVINDMPGPLKTAAVVVLALTAGLALVGGAALVAIPRIAAFKASLDTLAASEGRAAAAAVTAGRAISTTGSLLAGPVGIALAAAVTAFGIFAAKQADAKRRVQELTETLDRQTGAITEDTRVKVFNELQTSGMADAAQRLGINLADLTDAALGEAEALALVNRVIAENADKSKVPQAQGKEEARAALQRVKDAIALKEALERQSGAVSDSREKWQQQKEAVGGADEAARQVEPSVRQLGETLGVSGQQAEDASKAVDELSKELDTLFNTLFGVEEAEDATAEAFQRVIDTVKQATGEHDKHAKSLDGNSKAALANRDNVRNLVKSYYDQINALAESGANSDTLRKKTEELRKKFVDQMRQAGFSEAAIAEYAAAFDDIPAAVTTALKADTAQALRAIKILRQAIRDIHGKTIGIHVSGGIGSGTQVAGASTGGPILGSTPKGVDAQLRRVAVGEHVLTAEDVDAMGGQSAVSAFRQSLHSGARTAVAAPTLAAASAPAAAPSFDVRVFVGDRELTDIVNVQISEHDRGIRRRVQAGVRR